MSNNNIPSPFFFNNFNPELIGPTFPPIPPLTLPTGPTGSTGATG
ncbi:exosporium leader peptide, partial [Bacillus sp. cl25]